MNSRHSRRMAADLLARLTDKDFLKMAGLTRRSVQSAYDRAKWEGALEGMLPADRRFSCAEILDICAPLMAAFSPEPEDGWIKFTYRFATHILYPDEDFSAVKATYAAGAMIFLAVLQFFFDEERESVAFDARYDFAFLPEEEYKKCDRAREYARFLKLFRCQYIYEMMRLNREATPFETLGHIAGVHFVAMTVARGLLASGAPIDLALVSGAAAGHDLGKFGCKTNERVPYLHYYYTHQWFYGYGMEGIGHIAANHSTWDLELDNISVESLCLIYADFRVKQLRGRDGREITEIYTLKDSFDVILSKLDNVDEAKKNRYRTVYSRLYDFERLMRSKGVDVELNGNPPRPEKLPDIVLRDGPSIIDSFLFYAIEHNIDVMHRLGTERQFGNILEAARSEKDWKNVRAYLNMFNEYSIHLNHRQKKQTLSFLYELLLNREGDIRRQSAALMGKIFADFNAGYRKELPKNMPDTDKGELLDIWEKYLGMLVCPDHRLTLQQKNRIQNCLKFMLLSAVEHADEALAADFYAAFMKWFDSEKEGSPSLDADSLFYLLDSAFSMPVELCLKGGFLDKLARFAMAHIGYPDRQVRIAAIRCLKVLTAVVSDSDPCYGDLCDAAQGIVPESMTLVFLKFRLLTNLRLDTSKQREILYRTDVVSDIFLENLKSSTPWIIKAVNIKLLVDQVDNGKREHLLHICSHLSNLIKVSEQVGVRHDAGRALLRLTHLLTADQRNEIAVELLKGLEVGEYEISKYIPEYLGEFSLWLPPEQLDDLIERLHVLLAHANERVVSVALDTLGVLLECYAQYPGRFKEGEERSEERRRKLLGLILSCLANYREQVRQEAMLVIGQHIFGSQRMSERDKNSLFSLCAKKLLSLLNENPGGELSLYYRAATLSYIYRFMSHYELFLGDVEIAERRKVAFFPGTFDPFTLSHKEIARKIRERGFTVYLAVDEFSWSKKTQPHLIRRHIVNMSIADEFYVHLFPDDIPVNIANPDDLKRLRELFAGRELYIVTGSDVIHNASAYKKEAERDSIQTFNHIVFRRAGEEDPSELYRNMKGKIVELELPAELEDVSSTKIRENIDNNRDISSLIDPIVQEFIYHHGLYLREPEFKPIIRARAISLENVPGDERALGELANTVLFGHPDAPAIMARIRERGEKLIILRNNYRGAKPDGFVSYREVRTDELFEVLKNIDVADKVRRKAGGNVLLITGIHVRENEGEAAAGDSEQILLSELISQALIKDITVAIYAAERGLTTEGAASALERQGFIKPEFGGDNGKNTIYLVDMHEPLLLLHNLDTSLKEPFASDLAVLKMAAISHKRLQLAMTRLYPGNLVLSLSSGIMYHRIVDRVTALNRVPAEPLTPRRLGENMCVPFGKIMRGSVVPNTVTKTLHTDKVYEPDLNSYTIEAFPYYSPLESQIQMIKSFGRPVILVDDIVHIADRLQVLGPRFEAAGIEIRKVVVGVISGHGQDLMRAYGLPVEGIYTLPNLKQWFLESTLYPFIGGDTVRRNEMKVAGLQPSVNMILPYAQPKLGGCTRAALFGFSECCLENARDLLRVLELEYRRMYSRNLTLSRLPEAVILPLCPDKGSCMEYDENLAASVYVENDLETLRRLRGVMV